MRHQPSIAAIITRACHYQYRFWGWLLFEGDCFLTFWLLLSCLMMCTSCHAACCIKAKNCHFAKPVFQCHKFVWGYIRQWRFASQSIFIRLCITLHKMIQWCGRCLFCYNSILILSGCWHVGHYKRTQCTQGLDKGANQGVGVCWLWLCPSNNPIFVKQLGALQTWLADKGKHGDMLFFKTIMINVLTLPC